ncbi:NADPH:quinone reductase [Streptomyces mashuensis]|uniref:NADPH:quinone reductase n=1 Tax=Streptomyces mashuensis TaxID=33904 RepID=A0A919B0Z0_9ACTN|nr:zinc-binding dehydrogenase [Streptomyces mashuensis]GHF38542.1 NADPH:quinone reductase [Streptomyces mashuensis]
MRAIVVERPGDLGALRLADVPEPTPVLGHELVTVTRAGVNFADISMRENGHLLPVEYPFIPGCELVGIAPDGRRVVALVSSGAYAEKALVPSNLTWDVPDYITDDQACALALWGQSAWHMLFTRLQVKLGETILIPAAAGGLGSLALQLALGGGRKVIALENGEHRKRIVRDLGAHAVVDTSTTDDLTERILDAAGGPVDAAMAVAGSPTLMPTLEALAPLGRMTVFGCGARKEEPRLLNALVSGSRTVSGFWLPNLFSDPKHPYPLMASMEQLFRDTKDGRIKPIIGVVHSLESAVWAHMAVEEGRTCRTAGKIMLDPTEGVQHATRPADQPFVGW